MDNHRCYLLLKQIQNNGPVSSAALAKQFSLSSRTVRNDLKEMMPAVAQKGAHLYAKSGTGYSLEIYHQESFDAFLQELLAQDDIPVTADGRVRWLLLKMAETPEKYIKIETIMHQLYISRSTVNADLRKAKQYLKQYHIALLARPNYGIALSGSELNIRQLIAAIYQEDKNPAMDQAADKIFDQLVQITSLNKFKFSTASLREISWQLLMGARRSQNHPAVFTDEQLTYLISSDEYPLACQIVKSLNDTIPKTETAFITLHLKCHRIINLTETPDYPISEEIKQLSEQIICFIRKICHINLSADHIFRKALVTHLIPMSIRARFYIHLHNPLLSQIKEKYALSYMIADIVFQALHETLTYDISEDEIGFITLHIQVALYKFYDTKNKSILVTGSAGKAVSQTIVYQIEKRFGSLLCQIMACDIARLNTINLNDYDFILTTSPLPRSFNLPVLTISPLLSNDDFNHIAALLKTPSLSVLYLNAKTINEVISSLYPIPASAIHDLLKNMVITDHGTALITDHRSHDFPQAVVIKEPVLYQNRPVQFILFDISYQLKGK